MPCLPHRAYKLGAKSGAGRSTGRVRPDGAKQAGVGERAGRREEASSESRAMRDTRSVALPYRRLDSRVQDDQACRSSIR
jgi:hypothetical protein